MLICVRHGDTAFNSADGNERLRGWLPIPLTLEGMKEAAELGESLSELENVKHLYTSDLVRTVQTAEEIAHYLHIPLEPKEELRDWNTGDMAGDSVKKTLSTIHSHIDTPDKILPGGQSFNQFLGICVPFLKELVEKDDICIAVTHNRVVTLLLALIANDGAKPDTKIMKQKGPIGPSGFIIVRPDWSVLYQTPEE